MIVVAPCRLQKGSRLARKVDYPSFGGVGVPAATAGGTSVSWPRPQPTSAAVLDPELEHLTDSYC